MGDKTKHLVLVVEHTFALAPYWTGIVENYLRKLIMAFCGNQNTNVELGLVGFCEIKSGFIQWSGWTNNVDSFFARLLAMQPIDVDGFCDVEIAQGLTSALKHLPSPSQTQKNVGIQKHCILVAASNPPNNSVTESKICLSDAEKVALSFPEAFVSLSVICPKELPILRSIYNAGKRNPLASDYTIDIVESPNDLVLISEGFIEACSNVSQSGITVLPSNPSGNDDLQNLRVAGSGSKNKSILNKLTQAHRMNIAAIAGGTSTEIGGNSMTMISPTSTKLPGLAQVAHHTTHGLLTAATPNISERSSLNISESLPATGTMSSPSRNIAQQLKSAMQAWHSQYVKLWEEDLLYRMKGQPVPITKLQACFTTHILFSYYVIGYDP